MYLGILGVSALAFSCSTEFIPVAPQHSQGGKNGRHLQVVVTRQEITVRQSLCGYKVLVSRSVPSLSLAVRLTFASWG
jgi:hypothetical protein